MSQPTLEQRQTNTNLGLYFTIYQQQFNVVGYYGLHQRIPQALYVPLSGG